MLHIHFGTGRLGLGLIAPFFQTPESELYLLNRAISKGNPTGGTALGPGRRNELLRDNPDKQYVVQSPSSRHVVRYDGFFAYDAEDVEGVISSIMDRSDRKGRGVIVTASVLTAENYRPVVRALDAVCQAKEWSPGSVGPIFLVACENTVTAAEVFEHEGLADLITPEVRCHVTPVHALVDRMCVELEEDDSGKHPTVRACVEEYGSLKLHLAGADTEPLPSILDGSRVEFTRYVDVEKQIKSWLLNGAHWLIALRAFHAAGGDPGLKLNQYLKASPENKRFAETVLAEMSEGVGILLRNDPQYAGFVRDVDVDRYLAGAAKMILHRFSSTDDSLARILARFRAPSPDEFSTIEAFNERFAGRVDEPLMAYESAKGVIPPAASQSLFSLHRLVATHTYVNAGGH
ncbi:MAG: hypothetical protein JWO31_3749 [Phycisphaerales bacterium]|nr:hypothetical protein [Phycisphaerales bacterium]